MKNMRIREVMLRTDLSSENVRNRLNSELEKRRYFSGRIWDDQFLLVIGERREYERIGRVGLRGTVQTTPLGTFINVRFTRPVLSVKCGWCGILAAILAAVILGGCLKSNFPFGAKLLASVIAAIVMPAGVMFAGESIESTAAMEGVRELAELLQAEIDSAS